MRSWLDPAHVDAALDSRAVTFENPTGERGAGGRAHGGRKGAPSRVLAAGERVVLADLAGPGRVRHVWMTFPPAPPEVMRGLVLEAFYDGASEPSVSVPALDFFGLPHGRPAPYACALLAAQEGRGFNAYLPWPFRDRLRIEIANHAPRELTLYYQIDYTLEPDVPADVGLLHAAFRRENPTVQQRDFTIHDGLRGPGRFLGCNVGIRVLDEGFWYGEGEMKVYRDGDGEHPTLCGTGLEDYAGSAWGMGVHQAPYAGVPHEVREPGGGPQPRFVSFYRWHLPDPIVFQSDCRVTIQQIGMSVFPAEDEAFARWAETHPAAGEGWQRNRAPGIAVAGIHERVDDYCATAYVYCTEAQPVPRLDPAVALADVGRLPFETAHPLEALLR
jgi:hypothetical protein